MTIEDDPARVYGPEQCNSVAGRDWSWWDLWCCVIAVKDHAGDINDLAGVIAARIRDNHTTMLYSRDSDDARLSHLLDLNQRLHAVGLNPADLAGPAILGDRKITSRARAKFKANIPFGAYARTPPMRDLPADRLRRRSRFGHWPTFTCDPAVFYDKFRPTIQRKEWVTERQTSRATDVLQRRLDDLDGPRRSLAERLALYRAFYTAAIEFADIADDSSGCLGDMRTETWLEYLKIDWRSAGMTPEHYWQDLCELRVWEDYGLDYQHENAWFASARNGDIDLIEGILTTLADEARSFVLDYQANSAKAAIKNLHRPPRSPRH